MACTHIPGFAVNTFLKYDHIFDEED